MQITSFRFKFLLLLILAFFEFLNEGKSQTCFCASDTFLNTNISCDTIRFNNQTTLIKNFDCNTSWYVFKDSLGHSTIIGGAPSELDDRIGMIYAVEYSTKILFENKLVSGCCEPPEYYLYDKNTGQPTDTLGKILYYSENKELPIIISLDYGTNTDDSNPSDTGMYNAINFLNVDTKETQTRSLKKDRIRNTLKITGDMYPELLFDEIELKDGVFIIKYKYKITSNESAWLTDTITFALNNFR